MKKFTPTQGEMSLLASYVLIAVFFGLLSYLCILHLQQRGFFDAPLSWYERWMVFTGGFGGVAALHIMRSRFGRTGRHGTMRAAFGWLAMSFVAGVIAGSLALPLYGTMFGPLTLALVFAATPWLLIVWVATFAVLQVLLNVWQAERDSIFVEREYRKTADTRFPALIPVSRQS